MNWGQDISHFWTIALPRLLPFSIFLTTSLYPLKNTPKTWTASDNTTTVELVFVLGKTFQAHSCSAHKAYIRIGWRPARQRRNGVAHARYAKNW